MKTYFIVITLLLSSISGYSTNLKLSKPVLYLEDGKATAIFNLSWDNSWNNKKNHDAVWLFFKSIPKKGQAKHINVLPSGHTKIADFSSDPVDIGFKIAKDSVGVFIFSKTTYRGTVSLTLKIALDNLAFETIDNRNSSFKVFGIEMVHIPKGSFVLGDPEKTAQEYGSIYKPGSTKNKISLPRLSSETSALEVGIQGDIFYNKKEGYEGDQTGIIPKSFPKGVSGYYIMKYEITEGQYAAFLNTLEREWQEARAITKEKNYISEGGSIVYHENVFHTPYKEKPCKFMSWDDAMAFADWAGLRPMTEFEFTKASRGIRKPTAGAFPWGTNEKFAVQRLPDENGVLTMNNGWSEEKLSEENLAYFAASYYWVMDLSGSMWERVVSIGHPAGRSFTGSHGDGNLSNKGMATNPDWPLGNTEAGGVGFRGGGFYGYNRAYHQYNPFSPIAYRPYGGWHGTNRNKAYGGRLVRSNYLSKN